MDQQILNAIPHRDPFLFVEEIVSVDANGIHCRKTFTEDEFFYKGHYPHFPITPGVILCEAAMQAGAIFLSKYYFANDSMKHNGVPVVGRMNNVKFRQMVRPGDTIDMKIDLREKMKEVFFLKAKVTCNGKPVVTFDFVCTNAEIS